MFSLNLLFYGSYYDYAERCLKSVVDYWPSGNLIQELRIGMNMACKETQALVRAVAEKVPCDVYTYRPLCDVNAGKYPLMRRMFYDKDMPCTSPYVVWMDDDSYIVAPTLWSNLATAVGPDRLVGKVYALTSGWRGDQQQAFKRQPWYTFKAELPTKPRFIQGGFWVAPRAFLAQWDYPFKELHHNGGDSLLGEVARQQGLSLVNFEEGYYTNAALGGKHSTATRRGMATSWPWEKWEPDHKHAWPHQDVTLTINYYEARNGFQDPLG